MREIMQRSSSAKNMTFVSTTAENLAEKNSKVKVSNGEKSNSWEYDVEKSDVRKFVAKIFGSENLI